MAKEPKKIVQDVVSKRLSIRDIEIPSRASRARTTGTDDIRKIPKVKEKKREVIDEIPREIPIQKIPPTPPKEFSYDYEYESDKKSSKKWIYISLVILAIVLAFGISTFFKSAKITVTPKSQMSVIGQNFTAKKDETGNDLGFQIVTVTKDVEKTVSATGEKKVDIKATGKIVIFNNFSTASQKLVATTRFQTPEGLIYRLNSAVTVPGRQTVNGKVVAGSIEATVTADESGEKYNIDLKDFTIPGFKGDPKYTSIYGRSKTSMTGGFSGMQKIVSDDVIKTTDKELEGRLRTSLSTDINAQIPANFVSYPDSMSYSFSGITQSTGSDGNAILKKKGTAYAVIFDKGSLSRTIASTLSIPDIIKVTNLDKLSFKYASSSPFDPIGSSKTMTFYLSGDANVVWVYDANKLKSDLLGLSKSQVSNLITKYTSIKGVDIETNPFWNQTIPNDPNKVKIVDKLE